MDITTLINDKRGEIVRIATVNRAMRVRIFGSLSVCDETARYLVRSG